MAAATVLQSPSQLPGLGKHWIHLKVLPAAEPLLHSRKQDIMVSRTQQGFLLWAHLAPSSLLLSPVCPAPPHQTGRQESQLQPSCTCTLPREANACSALPRALAWGSLLLLEAPCWGGGLHVAPSTLLRTFILGQEAPSFWERNF